MVQYKIPMMQINSAFNKAIELFFFKKVKTIT